MLPSCKLQLSSYHPREIRFIFIVLNNTHLSLTLSMQLYKVQMSVFKNLFFYVHVNSTILVEVSKNNQTQIALKITWATLRDAVTTCACEIVNAGVPVCEALAGNRTGQQGKSPLAIKSWHHYHSSLSPISLRATVQTRFLRGAETSLIPLFKLSALKSSTTLLIFGKPSPHTNLGQHHSGQQRAASTAAGVSTARDR